MPPPIPYALVGLPIDKSPSPAMHNAAFKALGMNADYRLRPTGSENVELLITEMLHGKWAGINVTTPLKTIIAPLVKLQGHAQRAAAVNTLWRYGAEIHGALTDVDGVTEPLKWAGYTGGGEALILGGGGAARAAAIALDSLGATIHVATRNPHKAGSFLGEVEPKSPGEGVAISSLDDVAELFRRADVVIQATPVGSQGERHDLPWKEAPEGMIAFDMVYNPVKTPFLIDAQKAGCTIIEGWRMLLAQGAASQKIWTGRTPPVEVMESALRDQLGA